MGALSSLGFRFLDRKGSLLPPCGKSLTSIHKIIEPHFPELTESEFLLACDVNNPFYGKKGAAYVYSPQKGADPEIVVQLDRGLRHFHRLVKKTKDLDLQKIRKWSCRWSGRRIVRLPKFQDYSRNESTHK